MAKKKSNSANANAAIKAASKNKNISKTELNFIKEMLAAAKAEDGVSKKELKAIKKEISLQKDKGKGIAAYKVGQAPAYLKWRTHLGPKPQVAQSTVVSSALPQTNVIDGVNYKSKFQKEVDRILLSLINSADKLLLTYDFQGIDYAPSYKLEEDDQAFSSLIFTRLNRPQSSETSSSFNQKYEVSNALSQIARDIGDKGSVRDNFFGAIVGTTFVPYNVRKDPLTGTARYDLEVKFNDVVGAVNYKIRLYRIDV